MDAFSEETAPNELIAGKNYYIQKVMMSSGKKEDVFGRAIGIHFKGMEEFKRENDYEPNDRDSLGFARTVFEEGEPLATFKEIIPLDDTLSKKMQTLTHLKPYRKDDETFYKSIGYKFYELSLDEILNNVKTMQKIPVALRLQVISAIRQYIGKDIKPSASNSRASNSRGTKLRGSKSRGTKSRASKSRASKKGGRRRRSNIKLSRFYRI